MSDDNLGEFMQQRVLPTRQVHHVQYPVEMNIPAPGVVIDSCEDAITVVLLPTIVRDVVYVEIHTFVDGERVDPRITKAESTTGCLELLLRRPDQPA